MSGLVAIARYINDLIKFAYPNLVNSVDFSSFGVSSVSSSFIVTSIGVDTGFASCSPYFINNLSM